MKSILIILSIILSCHFASAKDVSIEMAIKVANNHILLYGEKQEIASHDICVSKDELLFHVFKLAPVGYIVVTANTELTPILAYSFLNNIDTEGKLTGIIRYDLGLRTKYLSVTSEKVKQKNMEKWSNLLSDNPAKEKNQLWPPNGSTSTGGWLETNWSQNSPYKDMCPMDTVTGLRSIAGCPSVAMAMIVNFHKTTNNVYFDNGDDYYHSYASRKYWIDDDYVAIDFPSFPMLNTYLDTLDAHYLNGISITNNDISALVFACGVACKQVYTSSAAGTFGVAQALTAYYKFNFTNIDILYSGDTTIHNRLMANMMDSLPAHLALVDSNHTMGHNIVVDGYDSNGLFHMNFGWAGSSNGWYVLASGIPHNLTVIEGIIIDIDADINTQIKENNTENMVLVYPNPSVGNITIEGENINSVELIDVSGRTIYSMGSVSSDVGEKSLIKMDFSAYRKGVYFLDIKTDNGNLVETIVLE
jgi:Peptidase C10 family/Secretion system C-terminal sorting domain